MLREVEQSCNTPGASRPSETRALLACHLENEVMHDRLRCEAAASKNASTTSTVLGPVRKIKHPACAVHALPSPLFSTIIVSTSTTLVLGLPTAASCSTSDFHPSQPATTTHPSCGSRSGVLSVEVFEPDANGSPMSLQLLYCGQLHHCVANVFQSFQREVRCGDMLHK